MVRACPSGVRPSSAASAAAGRVCQSSSVTNGMKGCRRRSTRLCTASRTASARSPIFRLVLQMRLHQFYVPVGVLVPDEVIQPVGGDVEPEPLQGAGHLGRELAHAMQHPPVDGPELARRGNRRALGQRRRQVHEHEPRDVPDLVHELPVPAQAPLGERDVHAGEASAAKVNRKASAPISSITCRGLTTLPFDLLIFCPCASRTSDVM